MNAQLLVLAKEPRPGQVKTRLCPPCSHDQAALVALAALRDTIDAASVAAYDRRTLVIHGGYRPPASWRLAHQRGTTLGHRIGSAFADTAEEGLASVLIGMDTPQVTGGLLDDCTALLHDNNADAVLGRAEDGGWWLLGLRDPGHSALIRDVPTSRSDTAALTVAALSGAGLMIVWAPTLRDVDTAEDARVVAELTPTSGFAAAVRQHVPSNSRVGA